MCISGTIVPASPSNPYYSCSSQSVSVALCTSVRSELRIRVVYRDPPRFPACSICKPPRNESVNPVTSFAAILALRRRRSSHFPPNPPGWLRLECKSSPGPLCCQSIGPDANSLAACDYREHSALVSNLSTNSLRSFEYPI